MATQHDDDDDRLFRALTWLSVLIFTGGLYYAVARALAWAADYTLGLT